MKWILFLFGITWKWEVVISVAESGDCENLVNVVGRNVIHNGELEVDPCNRNGILKKCVLGSENGCTTKISSDDAPYTLTVKKFNPASRTLNFILMLPLTLEFYIEAHASDGEGNISGGRRLGYFKDMNNPDCNSYACCDPNARNKTNVARNCPDMNTRKKTALKFKPSLYALSYSWIPPPKFIGNMVLVSTFSESPQVHYAPVTSKVVFVDASAPPDYDSVANPPPVNTPSVVKQSPPVVTTTKSPKLTNAATSSTTPEPSTTEDDSETTIHPFSAHYANQEYYANNNINFYSVNNQPVFESSYYPRKKQKKYPQHKHPHEKLKQDAKTKASKSQKTQNKKSAQQKQLEKEIEHKVMTSFISALRSSKSNNAVEHFDY